MPRGLATEDIGVATCRAFIKDHHDSAHLPSEPIFAFIANPGTPRETHVLVSDPCERLAIVGAGCHGETNMADARFDALLAQTSTEAEACGIPMPYAVTLATGDGVFSFNHESRKRRAA